MAESPSIAGGGLVRVSITSEGSPLPETIGLLSVLIERAVNRVPVARIVVRDGDMPAQKMPVSDAAHFKPGAAIVIKAGYEDDEETVFEGIVVRHGITIYNGNDARLVVECRDKAVRMTIGRCNANYVDQTDSDVIQALIGAHGLGADVQSTSLQHAALVQHFSTDWDFMLARAEANGLLVIAEDGTVSAKPPQTSAAAVLKVAYGVDLMDFQADIDARTQLSAAQGFSWDPKTQAVVQGTSASPPSLQSQGDLDAATLAKVIGLSSFRLQSGAPFEKEALKAWAEAQQLKAGLARIRGRMTFQGSAKAKVGGLIELEGVGSRFSGQVFVCGLVHEIADGNWTTQAEFGMSPQWLTAQPDVAAPPAAGLLPPVPGLQVGVVMKLDASPDGEPKIQVKVPVLEATTEGVWARVAKLYASESFGAFFLPEVGDEVLLGYFNADPSHPVVLGSLYSSKRKPPYELGASNDIKAIVTRCKHRIEFDEKDKIITITTPAENKVVISDKDKSILLSDQNGNTVKLDPGGIALDSPKDITCTAKGGITLDAVGAVNITSKADVKAQGLNVNCQAQVGFVAKGTASAELSASGQTTVQGAMVMIN